MCQWCQRSSIADGLTAGAFPPAPNAGNPAADPPAGGSARSTADVIFRNGTIRTMARQETVEALAIAGSTIMAAGPSAEITALAGPSTRVVDLAGRTLLPGFIDPHHHYVLAALLTHLLSDVGYAAYPTKAAALARLRSLAGDAAAGEWIAASFYDNLLQGGDLSMADLDAVSTTHPIFVFYVNGHVGAANTLGFQRAGIGEDVAEIPGGGHFGRGSDGTLNGLIYEQPALMRFIDVAIPKPTPDLVSAALSSYLKGAAAAGNTTLHEPGTIKPQFVDALATLSVTVDVRLSASFSTDEAEASKPFAALGPTGRARRIAASRFSLYGMKFWADGSNQAEMAAQTQPYLHSSDKGSANYPVSQMAAMCRTARDAGWSILVHSQGDAAVDDVLDAIEQAYGADADTGLNRIEHATMARQDQIDRMKTLGVEPSFIPDFVHLYGAAYRDQIFGDPRAAFMSPFGAAAAAGIGFSLHSDAPAAGLPVSPLRHIQTAVTRRCVIDGSLIGAELALTVDEAIRAITVNAARHIGLGDTLGTLEVGREADLTILDSDPYGADPEKISAIGVSQTWVAGEKKFG